MAVISGDADLGLAQLVRLARQTVPATMLSPWSENVTTVRIPVVRTASRPNPPPRYQDFDATSGRWRPQSEAIMRDAMPLRIHIAIAVLVALSVVCIGGFVYAGAHPGWFFTHQRVTPAAALTAPTPAARMVLVSSTATAVTYRVPVSSYSLVVAIDHPTWIEVRSPAQSSALLLGRTLLPTANPLTIPIRGTSSIRVAARVHAIIVMDGATVLSTITAPILGTVYTFIPSTS